ncbi:hypothetical protein BBJ41_13890 [Burkholderia stabilis]|nr:hypothetical protein BBJ41_13890 [Burkholderia stabilis]
MRASPHDDDAAGRLSGRFFLRDAAAHADGAAHFHPESARIPDRRRACYAHRLPATGTAR